MFHPANVDSIIAENLASLFEFVERVRGSRWVLAAVNDALAICIADDSSDWGHVSQDTSGGLNIGLYVATHASVVALRRELAARGIRLRDGDKVVEYPEQNQQVHTLTAEGGTRVSLCVWFTAGAEKKRCEYVKVGTKTVEQPIYELRCSDAAAPVAAAAGGDVPF